MACQRILLVGAGLTGLVTVGGALAGSAVHMGLLLAALTNLGGFGSAIILSRVVWPEARGADRVTSVGVIALALAILSSLVLALTGRLLLEWFVMLLVGLWLVLAAFVRGRPAGAAGAISESDTSPPSARAAAAAALFLAVGTLALAAWRTLPLAVAELPPPWDAAAGDPHHGLTLLAVAAEWMRALHLSAVDMPFTSAQAAYEPPGAALVHLWALMPFHSALAARFSQLPLAILAAVALGAIGRHVGLRRASRLLAPAAWLVLPVVTGQSLLPGGLIVGTALALASVQAGLSFWRSGQAGALVVAALAAALLLGTSYESLVWMPPVLFLGLVAMIGRWRSLARRWRLSALAVGLLAAGSTPYLVNLLHTGNPIYPYRLNVAGAAILPGPFRWGEPIATHGAHPAPPAVGRGVQVATQFGWPIAVLAGLGMLTGWYTGRSARERVLRLIVATVLPAIQMLTVAWAGLEARHALPAVGWTLVGLGGLADQDRAWARVGWGLVLAAVAATLWEPLSWMLSRQADAGAWLAGLMGGLWAVAGAGRVTRGLAAAAAGPAALAATAAVLLGWLSLEPAPVPAQGPGPDGPHLRRAWQQLIPLLVRDDAVAYAGPVVPFRWSGRGLRAWVGYVPISGQPTWTLDRYDRLFRQVPQMRDTGPAEAHPARIGRHLAGWLTTCLEWGITWLVVARVEPDLRPVFAADEAGFPLERDWAERTGCFRRVLANRAVRAYRFDPERAKLFLRYGLRPGPVWPLPR